MEKGPIKILLVEDDADDARLIHDDLENASPVQLVHVTRLAEAEQKLGERRFDVVLLDLFLPDSKGLETLRSIHARSAALPIVILTGLDDEEMGLKAVESGAQDYLMKGEINSRVLIRAIRYAMDRKRLEDQLLQAQKLEAIGSLAGGLAHDFNNILTAITGYSELSLRRLGEEDPIRKNIQEIYKASQRAGDLTRQLLAFSRKQVMQPRVLNLNGIISNMERMLRRLLGEDIELATRLESKGVQVKVDEGQIEQVIMNLAVNARDAMPNGGKLTIETDVTTLGEDAAQRLLGLGAGPYVRLTVSDTGSGMDAEVRGKIFEPFFTTKQRGKGTGLGLATVYGIVKQSGGHIAVASEPEKGSTFQVYLPQAAGEISAAAREKPAPAPSAQGSETILLVEDEEAVRDLLREVLQGKGYRVLEARDGFEALRLSTGHSGSIDLLLTDVIMPKMNGRELAERLKPERPKTKVLYMSGYTDNAIVHRGVLEDGTAFLQKPFTPETLAQKVREILDKP